MKKISLNTILEYAGAIKSIESISRFDLYNKIALGWESVDEFNYIINILKEKHLIREKNYTLIWIGSDNNPRFDSPVKPRKIKEKWYAILAYNGTHLLNRQVISFNIKSKATNFARDLIGKLYKGTVVTSVVLEGPFKTMMQASRVEVILPPPNV